MKKGKDKERILKAARERITYRGKSIRLSAYFSSPTLKTRRGEDGKIYTKHNKNSFQTSILYLG